VQGVEFCHDFGIQFIVLEGDAKEIVLALKTGGDYLGRYVSIIANACHLLTSLQSWVVTFVKRDGNSAANKLRLSAPAPFSWVTTQ
jgi:hypothetical protein